MMTINTIADIKGCGENLFLWKFNLLPATGIAMD
jgi:hypothetical protein